MYKLLLTARYLRRKLIPIFAMLAVLLCTAMVIIVLSVMGGFLDSVREAGRTLMGDVSLHAGLGGFPHYEELIERIEALPQAEAAAPVVEAYGLLSMPNERVQVVQAFGIDAPRQHAVTGFGETLFWHEQTLAQHDWIRDLFGPHDPVEAAMNMQMPWSAGQEMVPMVSGLEVNPGAMRQPDATYHFADTLIATPATLNILPVTRAGGFVEPTTERVVAVNEFQSGVYEIDKQRIYLPFDVLQEMMMMYETQRMDTTVSPPRPTGEVVPARATEVVVRAAPGFSADQLRHALDALYDEFRYEYDDMPLVMSVQTWEQRQAQFLQAIQNERNMMAFLFGVISLTAVVMIGVIFYMIVLEKTRDIGILRAIGASRRGVAAIFLSFGAAVGTMGAAFGTILAYYIVTYLNEIHDWLGRTVGIQIWDRSTYYFERIPDRVDWFEVAVIVAVAIIASVAGTAMPALKAARVDPVASLRYE